MDLLRKDLVRGELFMQQELSQVGPLYQINVECAHCQFPFKTSRIRSSFKVASVRDEDFCIHYKDPDINPDYYVVRVCPMCGFAATENFREKLTDTQKRKYMETVAKHWTSKDYGGQRTWEEALSTYKLSLLSAQTTEESNQIIASILHHIAWMYRYRNDKDNEQRFLQHALDAYIRYYELEGSPNDAKLMYIIGELSRRLKHYSDAIKWFGRVINDKKIVDAAMIQASRAQWKVVREDMLADQLELPEELN